MIDICVSNVYLRLQHWNLSEYGSEEIDYASVDLRYTVPIRKLTNMHVYPHNPHILEFDTS